MKFEIVRGGDDSAALDDLTFKVDSTASESGTMNFKFTFDNPLMVSIGAQKDKMVATVIDGSFFASGDGMPVPEGT